MAILHASMKVFLRSEGAATGAAPRRPGFCLVDARTGLNQDYFRLGGVIRTETFTLSDARTWPGDPAALCDAAEMAGGAQGRTHSKRT